MSFILVIIIGAVVGFIVSKIRGSGFGLWKSIVLGIAGSAFASSIMFFGYVMNYFPWRNIVGINFFSISVDITGALIFMYLVWTYNRARLLRGSQLKIIKAV